MPTRRSQGRDPCEDSARRACSCRPLHRRAALWTPRRHGPGRLGLTLLVWSDRVCPACALRVHMVRNGSDGVARLIRADWAKVCPRAVSLGEPLSCPDLQRALVSRGANPARTPADL